MKIHFKQANAGNYKKASRTAGDIQYLVIHYTANDGDTAQNNADYFERAVVTASAHYFVDETEVWQSVREADIAWHCGTSSVYYHPYCRNSNSIGVELCSRLKNGQYYFTEKTVRNAQALVRELMARYRIPVERIVRHYDVTHKNCPAPFVENTAAWQAFLNGLQQGKEDDDMTADEVRQLIEQSKTVYNEVAKVPDWSRATVDKLVRKKYLQGQGSGSLALTDEMLRLLVIGDRAGIFGE